MKAGPSVVFGLPGFGHVVPLARPLNATSAHLRKVGVRAVSSLQRSILTDAGVGLL